MKLVDFWQHLPGEWKFERILSNKAVQIGSLNVVKADANFYKASEQGIYQNSDKQTFFRNYNFRWKNNILNIYGENPRDGYVLLHSLSDTSRTHMHLCNKDMYQFELIEIGFKNWSSVTTITGPYKDLKLITYYTRSDDDLL